MDKLKGTSFEKWLINNTSIMSWLRNHNTYFLGTSDWKQGLETFYSMPFPFQMGVVIEWFRSEGYNYFECYKLEKHYFCYIRKVSNSLAIDGHDYNLEQAFNNLLKKYLDGNNKV